MNKKQLIKVAEKVRAWAEHHAFARGQREKDFFKQPDLSCMCAYSSTVLARLLKEEFSIDVEIVGNDNHVFVKAGKHYIDITATQFGVEDKVYIPKPERKKDSWSYWCISERFDSYENAFPAYSDLRTGFPRSQYFSSRGRFDKVYAEAVKFVENC